MLEHKSSNTPYSYGMMLATTAASSLPFFYWIIFYSVFNEEFDFFLKGNSLNFCLQGDFKNCFFTFLKTGPKLIKLFNDKWVSLDSLGHTEKI